MFSGLPVDDNSDNVLSRSLIEALEHCGSFAPANSMADAMLPLECSHCHVFDDGPPAGLQAVITGEKHLQTAAVRGEELHGYRFAAVVPLPDEAAVFTAKGNGPIDTLGYPGAFEDDICTFGANTFEGLVDIGGLAVDGNIGPQFLRDDEPSVVDVDGDLLAAAVHTASDDAQSDEACTVTTTFSPMRGLAISTP